jgi:hypothetical protein
MKSKASSSSYSMGGSNTVCGENGAVGWPQHPFEGKTQICRGAGKWHTQYNSTNQVSERNTLQGQVDKVYNANVVSEKMPLFGSCSANTGGVFVANSLKGWKVAQRLKDIKN